MINNMSFLDRTSVFLLSLLTGNDSIKHFPKEFVRESVQWIRSCFLMEDSKIEEKLKDESKSIDYKKGIIEMKIEKLQEQNAHFLADLEQHVEAFESQLRQIEIQRNSATSHNVITASTINAGGNVHVGDSNNQRTVIHGDQIHGNKIERQITIGDASNYIEKIEGNGNAVGSNNTTTIHNYYAPTSLNTEKQNAAVKNPTVQQFRDLIAQSRLEETLEQLKIYINIHPDNTHLKDEITMLSARLSRLSREENMGIVGNSDANIERNKITNSLTMLIGKLSE